MARFEELQELWQNQPARVAAAFDARGLTEELRRFGRNQMWINLIKLAVMTALFVRMMNAYHWASLAICGVVLLYTGLLVYLVLDWRNQIGISKLDFSAPSLEFVRRAYGRLQYQLNPMRRFFWLFVVCIGGGFNLILMAGSGRVHISERLGAAALPFFAYVAGAKIREFRFRRECGAVLEKLETLLRAMEEQAL